mmetsp:Transcript_591/g.1337  ORF Transcript_591/g.1337 Transcript_591/m.1337 type:complete len:206 (-) Transcript_591:1408-2025(-)
MGSLRWSADLRLCCCRRRVRAHHSGALGHRARPSPRQRPALGPVLAGEPLGLKKSAVSSSCRSGLSRRAYLCGSSSHWRRGWVTCGCAPLHTCRHISLSLDLRAGAVSQPLLNASEVVVLTAVAQIVLLLVLAVAASERHRLRHLAVHAIADPGNAPTPRLVLPGCERSVPVVAVALPKDLKLLVVELHHPPRLLAHELRGLGRK